MSAQTIIEIDNVTKIFGDNTQAALKMLRAGASKADVQAKTRQVVGLKDVSIKVERGEIFVVMGLSGSGKSTLIRHVNRLIDPTSGSVRVNGVDILAMSLDELREYRRGEVAMVFQNFGLLPHRNVIDNVAYGLEVRGLDKKERHKVAARWIETVGLAGYENSRPHELSGGQQQRVGLARALAMDTEVLLMDEAFSALDPLIRSGMQEQLLELQKKLHKTIFFITHDFNEAIRIGDRIAVLNDGELVQTGRPEEIVLHPADNYVADFVRDVNRARVIRVASIMDENETGPLEVSVAATSSCEDVLPLFASNQWVGVVSENGERIGAVSAKQVIAALARYQEALGEQRLG
ncbi:Glycine betaine/L-proline transport ATP-binding protein ProV (TC 3.A.1.12.1) [hydrothermal vent metagenome]|uniref:Glycine betaine/L-proline transport ATP-binding protein ProV (TC 3.A.1.12.1) n=1 Tax=hydrothermal vent metagenome TaxID=652676 RepID=A0A3B0TI33_9ZZZZ